MHLKLKSYLKCVTQCIQASLDVFRQKKIIRKIPLFFLANQVTEVELPTEVLYLFGGLALTALNICLQTSCTHFLFHNDYYFVQNGPYFYSERFRKGNLLIKLVRIQSTWGRLGSLINVMLLFWQKCKQAYEVSAMQSQTVNSYIFEPTMITVMRNGLKRF